MTMYTFKVLSGRKTEPIERGRLVSDRDSAVCTVEP